MRGQSGGAAAQAEATAWTGVSEEVHGVGVRDDMLREMAERVEGWGWCGGMGWMRWMGWMGCRVEKEVGAEGDFEVVMWREVGGYLVFVCFFDETECRLR